MLTALTLLALSATESAYIRTIEDWRADREVRLKTEDGWLSVAGLFWLKPGENRVGSRPTAEVKLPAGSTADAGTITLSGDQVTYQPARGTKVTLNGRPAQAATLKTDRSGAPDVLGIERLRLHVIHRGRRFGVRLKDPASEFRRNFTRLRWYPVRADSVVRARFVPYPKPRIMQFDSQSGDKQEMSSPGYVEFVLHGRRLRLVPVSEERQLFFIFRDKTAGKSTYGAARFLYAELAKENHVTLDFNKAYNPPCVFTPYATCPLPPPENRLPVLVEAGEKMYASR